MNEEFQNVVVLTDKYAHSQDVVNILEKNRQEMYTILCHRQLWTPTNKSKDLTKSFYVVSEKLAELTAKFDMLCMEVHDNITHIKLNENRIVSIMGNDREGGTVVLPSAPLRSRYSEDCLAVINSEPKETENSVGVWPYYPRRSRRLEMWSGVWMYYPRHLQSMEMWRVIWS